MDRGRKIDETIRLLKKHYWGNILILLLLFLPVTLGMLPFFDGSKMVNLTVEMYDIVITLIAIPLSLKQFGDKVKKATRPMEVEDAIRVYKRASFWRLYTLSVITLVQILLFGLSGNRNFFWLTVVLFTVFLFCKPSYVELAAMTEQVDNEKRTKMDDTGESHYSEERTNDEDGANPKTMEPMEEHTDKKLANDGSAEDEKGKGDEQTT
ncbi:MAG TPA: hypothetical protein GXZ56_00440 [Bacteroidales bacterium]|nr:hypothetical protein [Bacteroidales bacterium]